MIFSFGALGLIGIGLAACAIEAAVANRYGLALVLALTVTTCSEMVRP